MKDNFIVKVFKFVLSGAFATAIDYFLYLLLVHFQWSPLSANITSYTASVVVNFAMQKRFVFDLQRSVSKAFALAMLVSLVGMGISTFIVVSLSTWTVFNDRQYIIKLIATGIVFIYNFYFKRYVFEKKFSLYEPIGKR
jgi:putative flippase GtrA